jgi:hypothetical protein
MRYVPVDVLAALTNRFNPFLLAGIAGLRKPPASESASMSKTTTIDRWDITPYVGLGPLRFGLTRSEVRALLGDQLSVVKKWPYTNETDAYNGLGLLLEYDKEGRLECLEAFASCPIYYQGTSLLKSKSD